MIDIVNEVFDSVAKSVREKHESVNLLSEYVRRPAEFPAVTVDEIRNTPVDRLEDSSKEERYASVTYRVQVFSNKRNKKKTEAREIFATVDMVMRVMGFRRITYTTTPELYDATMYAITATYEGVISAVDDVIYRE